MAGTRWFAAVLALSSLLASVPSASADCYYDTVGGGCVLLSYPDTTGNCLNYYTTIIDQISPGDFCYDGYYSSCLCATYAATTPCVSFADFSTTSVCPDYWQTVGDGLTSETGDITCSDPTVLHVAAADPPGGCPTSPTTTTTTDTTLPCCSTMCVSTC